MTRALKYNAGKGRWETVWRWETEDTIGVLVLLFTLSVVVYQIARCI